jgi:hypothetical protein
LCLTIKFTKLKDILGYLNSILSKDDFYESNKFDPSLYKKEGKIIKTKFGKPIILIKKKWLVSVVMDFMFSNLTF